MILVHSAAALTLKGSLLHDHGGGRRPATQAIQALRAGSV